MGLIIGGAGGPLAFSSASGGKVYGYNNINETAAVVVALINPSRQRIRFHNPGPNDVFIAPVDVQNVLGTAPMQPSNVPLALSNAALGGAIRVYGNGGTLDVSGECQGPWQALSYSGAGDGNPLTVIDSNI